MVGGDCLFLLRMYLSYVALVNHPANRFLNISSFQVAQIVML